MWYQKLFSVVLLSSMIACSGAPEQTCNIPESVTYNETVSKLIEKNCFQCHAPDVYKKKASRNKIFDYEGLKEKAEAGILMGSVKHLPGFIAMPYRKGVKIDSCDIEILQRWVDQGMKE